MTPQIDHITLTKDQINDIFDKIDTNDRDITEGVFSSTSLHYRRLMDAVDTWRGWTNSDFAPTHYKAAIHLPEANASILTGRLRNYPTLPSNADSFLRVLIGEELSPLHIMGCVPGWLFPSILGAAYALHLPQPHPPFQPIILSEVLTS